jgi:phosphatidylglycerol:prolipoprotein diacylglycerol transferase
MYPLLTLSPNIQIPTYFVVFTLAYLVGLYFFYLRVVKFENLSTKTAMDLSLIIMVFGFLGARGFHVVYELPDFYWTYPEEIYKFWHGGFVFYGGFLLAALAAVIFLRIKNEPLPLWADLLAPVISLAYIIGRLGTWVSGSGYGRPTSLPWGIIYPPGSEAPVGIPLHPTPFYAVICESLTLAWLLYLERNQNTNQGRGVVFAWFLILHGLGRIVVEQYRDDARGSLLLGFSVSTWISAGLVMVGVGWLIKTKTSRPKPN